MSLTISPLISMLRYLAEESVLSPYTRIIFHHLIRLREEALFIDQFSKIKGQFGDNLDLHIWITRQESPISQLYNFPSNINIHTRIASIPEQVGQTWHWWNPFTSQALEHFIHKDNHDRSLVYICGPQGLTDKLVDLYKDNGMTTEDGHVQIEKWW